MSFFMVASFYVAIKLFYVNVFQTLSGGDDVSDNDRLANTWIFKFFHGTAEVSFDMLFTYTYMTLIIYAILISLAVPIDKAVNFFRVIAAVFAVLTTTSLIGIAIFLVEQGFYPKIKKWDPEKRKLETLDDTHFSILTLAGYIMLAIYFVPMILRPIDFLKNIPKYTIGLLSYILLLPTFINVM